MSARRSIILKGTERNTECTEINDKREKRKDSFTFSKQELFFQLSVHTVSPKAHAWIRLRSQGVGSGISSSFFSDQIKCVDNLCRLWASVQSRERERPRSLGGHKIGFICQAEKQEPYTSFPILG